MPWMPLRPSYGLIASSAPMTTPGFAGGESGWIVQGRSLLKRMETLQCDHCHKIFGYGSGDLNCCAFLCPACHALSLRYYRIWTVVIRLGKEHQGTPVADTIIRSDYVDQRLPSPPTLPDAEVVLETQHNYATVDSIGFKYIGTTATRVAKGYGFSFNAAEAAAEKAIEAERHI